MKMNKYQEALNELSYPLEDSSCGGCKCGESDCSCEKRIAVETLQELVDRNIPKKPIKKYYVETSKKFGTIKKVDFRCPNCKTALTNGVHNSLGIATEIETKFIEVIKDRRYCSVCGKAIDWSDEK